ncbi:MAG: hypothetical protein ACMXX8_03015, partial [Candidatus Woesearchaeota archaeon]
MANFFIKWKSLLIILLLGLFVLILPHFINLINNDNILLNNEFLFNMNIANQISHDQFNNNFFILEDENAFLGRDVLINPYQILFSFLKSEFYLIIISIILGLFSLILIYLILKKFDLENQLINLSLVLLILSPIFIYTFSLSSKYSMIIFLFLLGYYFFIDENKYSIIISVLSFSLLSFFGNLEIFLTIFLLLTYVLITKKKIKKFIFILSVILIILISFNLLVLSNLEATLKPEFIESNFFKDLISDFGSNIGLGLFKFLISIIGITILWNKRSENIFLIILFSIIISSFMLYNISYLIYANFLICYLAAIALNYFINRKWHVEILKNLTLITILSGLLFSSVSYVMVLTRDSYDDDKIDSLIWLKENKEKGLVLSHFEYGFLINYYSKMPVLMDSYLENNLKINNFYRNSNNIFYSQRLTKAIEYLNLIEINYIWITNEMKEGLVWD